MIDKFSGDFAFLSNFHLCEVVLDGIIFKSVEHAFQAAKTTNEAARVAISAARTPGRIRPS